MPLWTTQQLSSSHTIVTEAPESGGRVIADNVLSEFAPLMAAAPRLAQSLQTLLRHSQAAPQTAELRAALDEAVAALNDAGVPA